MDNIKLKKLLSVLLGTPDDGVQKPVVLEVIEVLHVFKIKQNSFDVCGSCVVWHTATNSVTVALVFLLRIREVSGSNIASETGFIEGGGFFFCGANAGISERTTTQLAPRFHFTIHVIWSLDAVWSEVLRTKSC